MTGSLAWAFLVASAAVPPAQDEKTATVEWKLDEGLPLKLTMKSKIEKYKKRADPFAPDRTDGQPVWEITDIEEEATLVATVEAGESSSTDRVYVVKYDEIEWKLSDTRRKIVVNFKRGKEPISRVTVTEKDREARAEIEEASKKAADEAIASIQAVLASEEKDVLGAFLAVKEHSLEFEPRVSLFSPGISAGIAVERLRVEFPQEPVGPKTWWKEKTKVSVGVGDQGVDDLVMKIKRIEDGGQGPTIQVEGTNELKVSDKDNLGRVEANEWDFKRTVKYSDGGTSVTYKDTVAGKKTVKSEVADWNSEEREKHTVELTLSPGK